MPTDEQRKDQIEEAWLKWEGSELGNPSSYLSYEAGYLERDAEVERLVADLTGMVVAFDPSSEIEVAAHQNAVMLLAEYLPELGAEHAN